MQPCKWDALVHGHPDLSSWPAGLQERAEYIVAPCGRTVFGIGTRPRKIFWVVGGDVRLIRRSRNGAEIVLQRASSGFIAEASLDSPLYHCDAVAATPSRLLAFRIGAFRQALQEDETFRAFWMRHLARELRALRSQCERLALHGAAERIEHYIESEGKNGRLELSRTRKAWAAELGLTHEALYRALSGLERAGKIAFSEENGRLVLAITPTKGRRRAASATSIR